MPLIHRTLDERIKDMEIELAWAIREKKSDQYIESLTEQLQYLRTKKINEQLKGLEGR